MDINHSISGDYIFKMINWTSNSKFFIACKANITITYGGKIISRILQIFSVYLNIDTDGSLQLPFTPPSHPFYLPLGSFFSLGVYISLISNTTFYPTLLSKTSPSSGFMFPPFNSSLLPTLNLLQANTLLVTLSLFITVYSVTLPLPLPSSTSLLFSTLQKFLQLR